jgi:RNAse (barnase) inhibitor barstar
LGTYKEILDIFDEVEKEFKGKIKEKIKEVAREKIG